MTHTVRERSRFKGMGYGRVWVIRKGLIMTALQVLHIYRCTSQKFPTNRSIDSSLSRRQVHTKLPLQLSPDLAFRNGIGVHVMKERLHSAVDLRVR